VMQARRESEIMTNGAIAAHGSRKEREQ